MLIKNGIVLVEEIDIVRREGAELRDAIVTASTSRLRPVLLAAGTTSSGMIPLLVTPFCVYGGHHYGRPGIRVNPDAGRGPGAL